MAITVEERLELLSFVDRCSQEMTEARDALERGDLSSALVKFGDLGAMLRGKAIEFRRPSGRRAA